MTIASQTLDQLLDSIAAKTPTPGGGATAATTGALAAAQARMVVSYSLGKMSLAEHQPALEAAAEWLDRAAALYVALADADASAYLELSRIQKLPETDPERTKLEPQAIRDAIDIPRAAVAAGMDLLRRLHDLPPITNRYLHSDLAVAAALAEAAAAASACSVRINLPLLRDDSERLALLRDTEESLAEAGRLRAAIESACLPAGELP